jgi:RHS repeat-associated protein
MLPSCSFTSRADAAGTTSYGYDNWGRLSSITAPFSGLSNTTYTFDDAGRQLTRTDPSGLVTTRTYDTTSPALSGRLLQETVKLSGVEKAHFYYTYDPVGNVLTLDQSLPSPNTDSGTWTNAYDGQNRLITAQLGSNPITTYGYDGDGNRTSVKVGTGSAVITTYDSSGLPVSATDNTSYSFDAAGNMTSISGPRNWTFTFDSWDRTKTAVGASNNPSITYSFDALDRMISRVRNGSTSTYVNSGTTETLASLTAGGTTTYYASSPGGPLAQKSGTTVKVYEPNLHGDLSLLANTSGSITGTASYGPFGDKRSVTGDTSYFSFQSDPTDNDTGFVDMGTRLYDPQTGRFSARDALFGVIKTPLSLNQYVYATDNPVSMTDPNGMCPVDEDNPTCHSMNEQQYVWSADTKHLYDINKDPIPPPPVKSPDPSPLPAPSFTPQPQPTPSSPTATPPASPSQAPKPTPTPNPRPQDPPPTLDQLDCFLIQGFGALNAIVSLVTVFWWNPWVFIGTILLATIAETAWFKAGCYKGSGT